jgi:hypothetical protein
LKKPNFKKPKPKLGKPGKVHNPWFGISDWFRFTWPFSTDFLTFRFIRQFRKWCLTKNCQMFFRLYRQGRVGNRKWHFRHRLTRYPPLLKRLDNIINFLSSHSFSNYIYVYISSAKLRKKWLIICYTITTLQISYF